jgi:hypothetical protein
MQVGVVCDPPAKMCYTQATPKFNIIMSEMIIDVRHG